jgi:16S rRNA pseudouridine516 synthase
MIIFSSVQTFSVYSNSISSASDGTTKNTSNETFLPAILEPITESSCYLTIQEGKYHQVKKMTHELGVILTYLKRIQIGCIKLPKDLETGKYIEIDEETIKKQAFCDSNR